MYDYSKLKGRIIEKCGTQEEFAKRMGFSDRTRAFKMQGKRPFKDKDIEQALKVLDIDRTEIPSYFFALKVR